jgi:hypothetical protein
MTACNANVRRGTRNGNTLERENAAYQPVVARASCAPYHERLVAPRRTAASSVITSVRRVVLLDRRESHQARRSSQAARCNTSCTWGCSTNALNKYMASRLTSVATKPSGDRAISAAPYPAHRARHGDEPVLVAHLCRALGADFAAVGGELMRRWEDYAWPGQRARAAQRGRPPSRARGSRDPRQERRAPEDRGCSRWISRSAMRVTS